MTIDLRSDTVTRPDVGMRQAMAEAKVGDAVFGEDPTVNHLEALGAEILGKAEALFVPSGIMANQIALLSHTRPGDEILLDAESHIFNHEAGAASLLSGVQTRPIDAPSGLITADLLEAHLRRGLYGEPRTSLLCLENTHNRRGGLVADQSLLIETVAQAQEFGIACHLDGARLWNAAVASGSTPASLAAPFDSVSACLSKGLGAPVGSLLAGSATFIQQARRYRHILGGNMRQAGIIAAAGIYALEHNMAGLARDHELAGNLADSLLPLPGLLLDRATVQTNIIMFDLDRDHAHQFVSDLAHEGVLVVPFGPRTIRITLHRDIHDGDLVQAEAVIQRLLVDKG